MSRLQNAAVLGMGVNAMLGVGLFLPMLPLLEAGGDLSGIELGILAGAFPLFEGCAGLLYPRLLSRIPAKWLMVTGQLCCAASCLFLIVDLNFGWLLIGRLLGGWGGASVSIAQYFIGRSHEGSERVHRLGQLGAAQALGFVIGLVTVGSTSIFIDGLDAVRFAGGFAMLIGLCSAGLVAASSWAAPDAALREPVADNSLPLVDLILYLLNTFVYISLAVQVALWSGVTPGIGVVGSSLIFIALAMLSMTFQARVAASATRAMGSLRTIVLGFVLSCVGASLFALNVHAIVSIAGLVVARIGYSLIVPTTLGRILGGPGARAAERRAGWAMFAASIGSCAGPVAVGAASDYYSFSSATLLLSGAALVGVLVAGASLVRRRTSAAVL